jgi:hypothetical protein
LYPELNDDDDSVITEPSACACCDDPYAYIDLPAQFDSIETR